MSHKKVGHVFLASLGKKRLRPGGITATQYLMKKGEFTSKSKVLEVACNMGTTLIEVVQKYDCIAMGVDLDAKALEQAQNCVEKVNLTNRITLVQGNALKLPFPDESFDIVINEAMLTMLDNESKQKAVAEYYRVLKPNGKLLTHDIAKKTLHNQEEKELSHTINMRVAPLREKEWVHLMKEVGFEGIEFQHGKMSLMNPLGMIRDEGFFTALKIVKNGLKKENREQFFKMFLHFKKNKNKLEYIAICSTKI